MAIDESTVRHIANLARLRVSDEEVAIYAAQLSRVLDYAQQLDEVNTDGVEPTTHPLPIQDVFRADEPREGWPSDEALANAPDGGDGYFCVPKVLDQETP